MIAVTKMFMSSIKMTVLAHYLTFSWPLQWFTKDYFLAKCQAHFPLLNKNTGAL